LVEPGLWLVEPGHWLVEPGLWLAEPGLWLVEPGLWLAEPGLWLVEPGLWLVEPGHWLESHGVALALKSRADLWVQALLFRYLSQGKVWAWRSDSLSAQKLAERRGIRIGMLGDSYQVA
jgi:hypothetical protein